MAGALQYGRPGLALETSHGCAGSCSPNRYWDSGAEMPQLSLRLCSDLLWVVVWGSVLVSRQGSELASRWRGSAGTREGPGIA